MPDVSSASVFLSTLNEIHPLSQMSEGWISFSVEKKTEANEASKSKQRKRSKTTVSIGDMPLTSQKKQKKKQKTKKTKNTFSQFAGNLYEKVDRVAMGSPSDH